MGNGEFLRRKFSSLAIHQCTTGDLTIPLTGMRAKVIKNSIVERGDIGDGTMDPRLLLSNTEWLPIDNDIQPSNTQLELAGAAI